MDRLDSALQLAMLFADNGEYGYAEIMGLVSINAEVIKRAAETREELGTKTKTFKSVFSSLVREAMKLANLTRYEAEIYFNGICSTINFEAGAPIDRVKNFADLMGNYNVYLNGEDV